MTWKIPQVSDLRSMRARDGTAFDLIGPDDAPVLALIHGLGLSRQIWDDCLDAFSDYRVLNYDLYGHGESGPTPEVASLATYSNQLAGLMDELELEQATVVGFSIGGMINRRFALDHPSKLSSLVILNSPHDRGEAAQMAVEGRAAQVREQGSMATLDQALVRWFTPSFLEGNLDVIARVRAWRAQVDAESYAQAAWVLANGVRELIAPEPPIAVPTLVMTCENDSGSTTKMAQDIAAEILGSTCQIIPGLQHLGLLEQPDLSVGPIVEHLDRVSTV